MASELGQPPSAAPTTITAIGDDLLREIFLLLPSLPSLVRAALACPAFLHAVRSSPAFRRRFRALHPPQLLGFFSDPGCVAIPPFVPLRSSSDPDLAAAVRGADFFLTRLSEDSNSSPVWELKTCHGGYVVLVNSTTHQVAAYNPLTQALHLFPQPTNEVLLHGLPEYILLSQEDQGMFSMVCVEDRNSPRRAYAVFLPATRKWQILPWLASPPLQPEDDVLTFYPAMHLNGFVYWKHTNKPYALLLNTVTLQFSRVDLPPFMGKLDSTRLRLGQTKDGKLCMVGTDDYDAETGTLVVWFWRADDDGVEKWIVEDTFPLGTFIDATKYSTVDDITVQIEALIDGFVYLSIMYNEHTESLLSLCLETAKLNKLFDCTYESPAHPYIMAWPPSLVCNKASPCLKIPEDSQTKVSGESAVDVAPVGTKETHSLVSAPQ
ncbi:hypothetical protein ACQJBY_045080 [Aegilops geniculata]